MSKRKLSAELNKYLKNIRYHHNKNKALGSLISTDLEDPAGYGRVIKNKNNQLSEIIEHKDANKKQKNIKEINSGIYIFNSRTLVDKIPLITIKDTPINAKKFIGTFCRFDRWGYIALYWS